MSGPDSGRDEQDLADLRHHWGEAYLIHHLGARWVAQRRDSRQCFSADTRQACSS